MTLPHTDMSSSMAATVIAIGLVGALVCYLRTNLSPGGLIVPGVLALTVLEGPASLGNTVLATAATFGAVKLLSKFGILYGKRLFAACLLISAVLELTAFIALHKHYPAVFPEDTLGMVLPGLVCYQMFKQKPMYTVIATAAVAAFTAAVAMVAMAV